jgi:sulfate transport system ATP-binding protein
MAIEVRNISKSFGATPVLEDISLDVQSGALTALLGPSGSGKSTLLRIIAGLETPDIGTVSILGQESTYLPPQRRNVGFVFQHYAAFKHLNVFRNVAFGLEVRKKNKDEIRKRVMELLELVHLDQFAERLPSQLSGGQRQRMALARALAVEPDVLLLDEPCSALDPISTARIEELMMELRNDYTLVVVTHNMQQAARVANMTAFFSIIPGEEGQRSGELVEYDDTKTIFTQPKDKRTEDYVTGRFG